MTHEDPSPLERVKVADSPFSSQRRPRDVVVSVMLFIASLLLGMIRSAISPPLGSSFVGVVVVAILAGLAYALWSQQGWARWVVFGLFIIGLPAVFFIRQLLVSQGLGAVAVLAVQTVMQGVALVLLFTPLSNAWFRGRRKPPK